jgi:hypothetical protein
LKEEFIQRGECDEIAKLQAEHKKFRVALARICCEAYCCPRNIAEEALGHLTVQEKLTIIKLYEYLG